MSLAASVVGWKPSFVHRGHWLYQCSFLFLGALFLLFASFPSEANAGLISGNWSRIAFHNSSATFSREQPMPRRAAISFIDRDGLMWYGFGQYASSDASAPFRFLSDMWTFNFTSLKWTYVGGPTEFDSTGNTSAGLNQTVPETWPAAHYRSGVCYDSLTHHAFVFGGQHPNVTTLPQYSGRLWRFDLSDRTWTWIGGTPNDSFTNPPAQKGTGGPQFLPQPRAGTPLICERVSESDGRLTLWFFSGSSLAGHWAFNFTDYGFYLWGGSGINQIQPRGGQDFAMWRDGNELFTYSVSDAMDFQIWIWNLKTKLWTSITPYGKLNTTLLPWVGPKGVATDLSWPRSREQAAFVSNGSNAFVFGGYDNVRRLDDLWMWDSSVFQWTFVSGAPLSTTVVLPSNVTAGARNRGTLHFVQNTSNPRAGSLYLFGGSTGSVAEARSDIHRLDVEYTVPGIPCTPPAPTFSDSEPGCNVRTRQWIVDSLPSSPNATVIIPPGGVIVLSNITIGLNSSVQLSLGDVVSSSKCVTLSGGNLVLVSDQALQNSSTTLLISEEECLRGKFDNVTINAPPPSRACETVSGSQLSTPRSLIVVFNVDTSLCAAPSAQAEASLSSGIPGWAAALIAVGAVFVVLAVGIILVTQVHCLTVRFIPTRLLKKSRTVGS